MKKALFIQRLGAYVVDLIIIFIIGLLISSFVVNTDELSEFTDEASRLQDSYLSQEISQSEYFELSTKNTYEMGKVQVYYSGINIVLMILYFIVFQIINKGQTLGKKLFKIKVIGVDGDINKGLFVLRSLFINMIISSIFSLLITIFGNYDIYLYYTYFEIFLIILIFISISMIVFRKDSRGLHDLFAKTDVIRV